VKRFEVTYLPEAIEFLESIAAKAAEKLIFNISKSQAVNDAKVFKKLKTVIFGSLGLNTAAMNTDCLHFGINGKTQW
jgi:hypothetical protein